jgi:hypothetical protein
VEWAYLPLLDRHKNASPTLLEQRLATEPGFFCEVIRLVFRSKKEEHTLEEATEEKEKIAGNAYRLLSEWRTPPGCKSDGTYDGVALSRWLDEMKKECLETGHLEIALTMLGHSLIHVPSDPGGLWIHRSAASALNAKDASDMRNGFRTELYNSRGAHWVDPTGAPERKPARKLKPWRLLATIVWPPRCESCRNHTSVMLKACPRESVSLIEYLSPRSARLTSRFSGFQAPSTMTSLTLVIENKNYLSW